ncbi:hypothetical protein ACSMFR_02820 [Listeria aquatica]|uniref:hypothetical protein n=1 Tax=Listeria aquatica TaxID=1494960 RepID=UPI003F722D8D
MNNQVADISILLLILSLVGSLFSLSFLSQTWGIVLLIVGILVFIASIVSLIFYQKQAEKAADKLTSKVNAKLKWWKTGTQEGKTLLFVVIQLEKNGNTYEKYYTASSGTAGLAELTLFLEKHPFDSEIEIEINNKNLSSIRIPELNLVMSDSGKELVKQMYSKWKTKEKF